MSDPVNHPKHYTEHPSGVECITITEHMTFCLGNAVKYIWRAGDKGDPIQDLEKARWYVDREIQRLQAQALDLTVVTPPKSQTWRQGEVPPEPVPGWKFETVISWGNGAWIRERIYTTPEQPA